MLSRRQIVTNVTSSRGAMLRLAAFTSLMTCLLAGAAYASQAPHRADFRARGVPSPASTSAAVHSSLGATTTNAWAARPVRVPHGLLAPRLNRAFSVRRRSHRRGYRYPAHHS